MANVIFIHPDGAGPSHWSLARLATEGPDGRINWDRMTEASVYLGHLDDQIGATSNAGAVAHAYGIKPVAPSYGFDGDGNPYQSLSELQGQLQDGAESGSTIMEEAIAAGKPTAVIQSGFIAEPGTGVFLADAESRGDREGITAQIVESGADVILGAGEVDYLPEGETGVFGVEGTRTDGRNLITEAEQLGYEVVYTREELQALPPDTERVLGIFAPEDTYNDLTEQELRDAGLFDESLPLDEQLITYGQPDQNNPDPVTTGEMMEFTLGLDKFTQAEDGFFIVAEEEATDNFGNDNNTAGVLDATLRADAMIGAAQDFVDNVNPNTLIITAADSAAGGLQLDDKTDETVGTNFRQPSFDDLEGNVAVEGFERNGQQVFAYEVPLDGQTGNDTEPFVTGAPDRDGDIFEFGAAYATFSDVFGSIVTKTYGLNAEKINSTIDNTAVYRLMYETLFDVELDPPDGVPDDFDIEQPPEATESTGNVIFFHPDGTSPSHFAAARFATVGTDGRLNWDNMSEASVYLGHMDDRVVGTSNGGAVVHAYGIKAFSGSYGLDENGNPYTSLSGKEGTTILEEAQAAGKAVGIVNSGFIAEPGSGVFLADVENRGQTELITAEIIESGADVILGGGETDYLPVGETGFFGREGTREDGRDLIEEAQDMGYTVVYTREELQDAVDNPGTEKLLGIFAARDTYNDTFEDDLRGQGFEEEDGSLIYYGQPDEPDNNPNPPTVAEMTEAALSILSQDEDGFMLVAEEEATDNFPNNGNAGGGIEATIRADAAIGVAQDFVKNQDPNTLLLTAADSDANGFEVEDVDVDAETVGFDDVQADEFVFPLDGQTGSDTAPFQTGAPDADGDNFQFGMVSAGLADLEGSIVAKAFGLNAETLPTTADNTDIYRTMYRTLFGAEAEDVADVKLAFGSTGNDVRDVAADADFDGAADLAFTGAGNDTIDTSTSLFGQNRGYGGSDDDELFASAGDRLFGGTGNDILDLTLSQGGNRAYGGLGDDDFFNGNNDRLVGGEGSDRFFLAEESGASVITGGPGADQFWIANAGFPEEANTITDFTFGEDVLGVAGIGAGEIADLDISQNGDNAAIAFDGNALAILLGVDSNALTNDNFAFANEAVA
jgi:glycerophosphoryl diester phosphodiesterase